MAFLAHHTFFCTYRLAVPHLRERARPRIHHGGDSQVMSRMRRAGGSPDTSPGVSPDAPGPAAPGNKPTGKQQPVRKEKGEVIELLGDSTEEEEDEEEDAFPTLVARPVPRTTPRKGAPESGGEGRGKGGRDTGTSPGPGGRTQGPDIRLFAVGSKPPAMK